MCGFEHPAHHHDHRIDLHDRVRGGAGEERSKLDGRDGCGEDAPIRTANLFYGRVCDTMPRSRMGTPRHEDLAETGPIPTDIRQVGPDRERTERGMEAPAAGAYQYRSLLDLGGIKKENRNRRVLRILKFALLDMELMRISTSEH